jgi:hypothetical protein
MIVQRKKIELEFKASETSEGCPVTVDSEFECGNLGSAAFDPLVPTRVTRVDRSW